MLTWSLCPIFSTLIIMLTETRPAEMSATAFQLDLISLSLSQLIINYLWKVVHYPPPKGEKQLKWSLASFLLFSVVVYSHFDPQTLWSMQVPEDLHSQNLHRFSCGFENQNVTKTPFTPMLYSVVGRHGKADAFTVHPPSLFKKTTTRMWKPVSALANFHWEVDISSVKSLQTIVQTWAILQVNPCKLYSVSYYKLQKGI